MFKKEIIARFSDFMLENQSPLTMHTRACIMGSPRMQPEFDFLVSTIGYAILRTTPKKISPKTNTSIYIN